MISTVLHTKWTYAALQVFEDKRTLEYTDILLHTSMQKGAGVSCLSW